MARPRTRELTRRRHASTRRREDATIIDLAANRHGPELHGDGTTTFRVWAPHATEVTLVAGGDRVAMAAADRGWHEVRATARAGSRYAFSLDGGPPRPDPASRRQPDGVHAPSALVDTAGLAWSHGEAAWQAPPVSEGVVYELHVGTFTDEGTFAAAVPRLAALRALGVTHVEVMPVAAFGGTRGWGYDGVCWYAVHEPYGGPAGFAAFVDACHRAGLAVILDVVHNHLGPSGNFLPEFGPYLAGGRASAWGEAVNLDGPGSDAVRGFVVGNALAWLGDYHVDALRLDAVHALVDTSAVHVLAEMSAAVAGLSGELGRPLELIAESDRNDPQTVRPRSAGGLGLDAQWSDDLHHALHVAITGEREGYYADYGGLADVAAAYERGFVYDGARYSPYRQRTVGAPLGDVPGNRLVGCLQNHDQVGNRAFGERLETLADADAVRLAVLLLVAAPHVPLLFMGEEHAETNPFLFFCDYPEPELADAVRAGRASEFAAFTAFSGEVPDPLSEGVFHASRVAWDRRDEPGGRARLRLWHDLLAQRRCHAALHAGRRDLVEVVHAGEQGLVVVRGHPSGPAVAVAANLDRAGRVLPGPAGAWVPLVATCDPAYGGPGGRVALEQGACRLPARTAALWAEQR